MMNTGQAHYTIRLCFGIRKGRIKKKIKALTAALSAAVITVSAGAFTAFADIGDVEINEINFPDDNFRKYVEY